MMNLTEKASYIKGLAEGMELDANDKSAKLILKLIDVIDDMALTISDLEDELATVIEQVDAVDEDLSLLEDDFYENYDEDDDEYLYDEDEEEYEEETVNEDVDEETSDEDEE